MVVYSIQAKLLPSLVKETADVLLHTFRVIMAAAVASLFSCPDKATPVT